MKIVIDIPDEYKKQFDENRCKEKFDSLATNEFGYILRKAFENGTPLPKVHEMREATPEELESINNYIKSISKPTGVNIWDEIEEVTTDTNADSN